MIWRLPHPVACTACGAAWQTLPAGTDPASVEIGMLIICVECAHCMVMRPGWHLGSLTRAEAAIVEAHPNFPNIRAMQRRVIEDRRLVG